MVGAQLGADTTRPAAPAGAAPTTRPAAPEAKPATAAKAAGNGTESAAALALFSKHNCPACHALDRKVLGPSIQEVAKKYASRADRVEYLSGTLLGGAPRAWGAIPCPHQAFPKRNASGWRPGLAGGGGW